MARPRTHHDEKKQELIKTSFELFMKNGYEDTSIQDIMNAANISKGAMYHYFTCKEDILDAVIDHIIDLDVKRIEPILDSQTLSPFEKMMSAIMIDSSQQGAEVQEATEHLMQRKDSIFDYRARELSKRRTIPSLAKLIKEGVESGDFHTEYPKEMAAFIYAAGQSMGELIAFQGDESDVHNSIGAFIQIISQSLGLKKENHDKLVDFFKNQFGYKSS